MAVFVLSRKAKGKRITEGATPNGMIKKMLDNAESGQLLGDKTTNVNK